MMKLEVNKYYRTRDGKIVLVLGIVPDCVPEPDCLRAFVCDSEQSFFMHKNGMYESSKINELDLVEELPNCTGFDWVPAPKYIPYTFDTSPAIVKCIDRLTKQKKVAYLISSSCFAVGASEFDFQYMFDNFTHLDGTPFGALGDE